MNWGQIRTQARMKLVDANSEFYPDSELLTYANDTLSFLATESEANTKTVAFALTASQRTYFVPPDNYEIRAIRVNGRKIFGSTAFDLEQLDQSYMTTEGDPTWYYQEGNGVYALYPISDGGSASDSFTSELGEVVQWNDGTSNYTVDSELGVVHSIIDSSGGTGYYLDSVLGVVIEETTGDVAEIEYVYRPASIVNDTDVPDMPTYMHWAMVYNIVAIASAKDGKNQNMSRSRRFEKRFKELSVEWFSRNREFARGQNQMLTQQPLSWTTDPAWRQRVQP